MRRIKTLPLTALGLALLASGCVGEIRETTSPRTSTEMLLVSTAAKRAIAGYDAAPLSGKRVLLDDSHFDSVDKAYVVSALRHHLARAGAIVAAPDGEKDLVLEIRNATLGVEDSAFTLGIPALPVESLEGLDPVLLPPLYFVRRASQQGWAKLQLWIYDPASKLFVSKSGDLWGHSYYNQWFFLGLGPFDFSEDIYPDDYTYFDEVSSNDPEDDDAEDEDDSEDDG